MSQGSTTSDDTGGYILYHYTPNKGAAILFTILILIGVFSASCVLYLTAHRTLVGRSANLNRSSSTDRGSEKKLRKSNIVCSHIPFFVGCLLEAAGYISRIISSDDKQALTPFIIQSVLLLIAPAFYAATIYMLFGRLLLTLQCEKLMLVSDRFGTTFFVMGDVISFILQAAGGGIMATANGRVTGSHLAVSGLATQIAFFGFFILNEIQFTAKVHRVCPFYWKISRKWLIFNLSLIISSLFIMVRSIVRLIEFIEGSNGFIISHEVFIYVFDATPMFLTAVTFCIGSYYGNLFKTIAECREFSDKNNLETLNLKP
ncbi:BDC_1c_G0031410.mRNA.1.CDS.1 [Saccharomyces cerevisiae]|nr:BDF_1d_G0031370.mRNA.1.CDS.1 [Saccharomyces cerevisiae]CAI4568996.1 BDC_1c_G0031410.mRNA.1.CDS.1 [Saccharomyces cerevisiae]CAI7194194.1 BDF_1d_G0031370.mRNA.1.CDS.1 [Saccharomyces cerevisiae]CAI7196932.1 BDC_1c_G0031410.mRNA.1.CDS.1 [Saccharomyces cerevisiae]